MTELLVPRYRVALVREDVEDYSNTLCSPESVAALLWPYFQEMDREHLIVVFVDTKNRVIGMNTVSVGTLDSTVVSPREVYKAAILVNAASIVVAHNHPSGDPTPSAEDRQITGILQQAGKLLGILLLDHLILGDKERYVSLKERGYL